jgi:hypothetical protein
VGGKTNCGVGRAWALNQVSGQKEAGVYPKFGEVDVVFVCTSPHIEGVDKEGMRYFGGLPDLWSSIGSGKTIT